MRRRSRRSRRYFGLEARLKRWRLPDNFKVASAERRQEQDNNGALRPQGRCEVAGLVEKPLDADSLARSVTRRSRSGRRGYMTPVRLRRPARRDLLSRQELDPRWRMDAFSMSISISLQYGVAWIPSSPIPQHQFERPHGPTTGRSRQFI